jgi:transcriptional regulator with XRE-family HTH domain
VRDIPQLKPVREDRGWSQRALAAKSGVAQNTITQLERGERKAMPSTIHKLAEALGVDPPVLMAESQINRPIEITIPPGRAEAWSKLPPKELDLQFRRERREQEIAAKRQAERQFSWFEEEPGERYERARRWTERFVSGDLSRVGDSFPEEQIASMRSHLEDHSLRYDLLPSLLSYPEDLAVARSRLVSNDPKEIVEAARLVLRRAKTIVEEYDNHLLSFHRIPDHYYEDPAAQSRIQKLQETLSERRVEAAEAVQELVDLYDESLDKLEDLILEMRKESDVVEEFVTQAHDSEG